MQESLSIFDGTTDNLPIMRRANVALTVLATCTVFLSSYINTSGSFWFGSDSQGAG